LLCHSSLLENFEMPAQPTAQRYFSIVLARQLHHHHSHG